MSERVFAAGAASVDIAPRRYPVLVNGNFFEDRANRVKDALRAKALVLDDGSTRIAIVLVDSCMMPRDLIDRAKQLAQNKTGISVARILIAATHTHSAPAVMGALGCPADTAYATDLVPLIVDAIAKSTANLEPAQVGWGKIDDAEHTFCRRWIRRPDKLIDDPFGNRNVRANMHPGHENPDVIGPAGPVDPALTLVSVQSRSGRPIAVLANYAMHYYGSPPLSSDYFGKFATIVGDRVADKQAGPTFVAMMSQGTSGDQMWMDYGKPKVDLGVDAYAAAVAQTALRAYKSIKYVNWVAIKSAERLLAFDRRVPDESRWNWAKHVVAKLNERDGVPRSVPEVYAREAVYLHDEPRRELKLQAFRIGDLGLTAIPNEVFAITGLKLKARSPFDLTMNIELANGSEGYIPPPEQHTLGGYTTWPARTAALEVAAEPKIVEALLSLLEEVATKPRRELKPPTHRYGATVKSSDPYAYWQLDDIQGPTARDSSGHAHHASYEPGVAFYLPGVETTGLRGSDATNRSAHFAGGRLKANPERARSDYSVELWFWNGLPADARATAGFLVSLGAESDHTWLGDQIGLGGRSGARGKLFFSGRSTQEVSLFGKTEIAPKTWHHLVVVRTASSVQLYLDGKVELEGALTITPPANKAELFVGGRFDHASDFEGKIDEISFYDRCLDPSEITIHYAASR